MSLDPIQTLFLVPVAVLGVAAFTSAFGYFSGEGVRTVSRFQFRLALTIASMAGVVLSRGKLQFLLAWEAMGLASAALVAFEAHERHVRNATWTYLLACHAGASALMVAGVLMESESTMLAAFFAAVVGFGLKIGFPPFHVWLPEAHPAAPSPASAVMSGAMIPLGFYGLLRFIPFTAWSATDVPPSCGWTLLALGAVGALGGILFAMAQSNLKRLLAFSSVENMGVISMALGVALVSGGKDAYAFGDVRSLALTGALLHILNHAFLKGALFIGAGAVLRGAKTLDQDKMGGLMRRMPLTGSLFTINALGLAGLPPLNGFLGELLIYVGAFYALKSGDGAIALAGFTVIAALSLTGALAALAYCKAIGAVFLGEPRSEDAANAAEPPRSMFAAQLALTVLSVAMVPFCIIAAHRATRGDADGVIITAAAAGTATVALTLALLFVRRFIAPRGSSKPVLPTWDCGYAEPTARMAYTATAFTQPAADFFRNLLRPRRHVIAFKGDPSAPTDAAIAVETDDVALTGLWRPFFTAVARVFQRAHLLQGGSLHLYILIILVSVVALLVAAFVK